MKGVTERLRRSYNKYNVQLHSTGGQTLRNSLVKPKDPLTPEEKCGTIYKIQCPVCGEYYVGESERSLGERCSEHTKSIEKENSKSALSQHQERTGHRVLQDGLKPEIIDMDNRNFHRKIKEGIHIRLEKSNLNRNEGYELPEIYLPLLRRSAEGTNHH